MLYSVDVRDVEIQKNKFFQQLVTTPPDQVLAAIRRLREKFYLEKDALYPMTLDAYFEALKYLEALYVANALRPYLICAPRTEEDGCDYFDLVKRQGAMVYGFRCPPAVDGLPQPFTLVSHYREDADSFHVFTQGTIGDFCARYGLEETDNGIIF